MEQQYITTLGELFRLRTAFFHQEKTHLLFRDTAKISKKILAFRGGDDDTLFWSVASLLALEGSAAGVSAIDIIDRLFTVLEENVAEKLGIHPGDLHKKILNYVNGE